MYPILFRIGEHAIRTYTVLIDAGLLAGLALAFWLWRRQKTSPAAFLDAVTWTLVGAVAGSRIAYVAAQWTYFKDHLFESVAIWSGGMSFHGAFLGGCLALALYALITRRAFWQIADVFVAGLSLGSIFGWLACFASGCAYGTVGRGFFFTLSPDIYGIEAPRFALQLAGAIQSLVVLIIVLLIIRAKGRPGVAFAIYMLLYFGGQAGLELWRADESILIGAWRLTQIVDLALAAAGALLFIVARDRESTETENESMDANRVEFTPGQDAISEPNRQDVDQ
jgi:phosphatidylglycerol---prolipoprotein diacylglyceryl transferase